MSLALPAHLAGGGDQFPPPTEFAEAVEMYARQNGRHGTLKFIQIMNCWIIEFTLRAADPRRLAWKMGAAKEEPKEVVNLWRFDQKQQMYIGYKLDELGISGLLEFLNRGNTSQSAESLSDSVRKQAQSQEDAQEKIKKSKRDDARHRGMLDRRQALGIPILPIGIDLKAPTTAPREET